MGLDSAQFERGVKNTRQPLAALRNQFLAVAGAATALGAAISAMAMRGAAEIDKTAKAARRVGSSIGGFRALEMAAGEAGVAVSTLADAVQTMDRQIARGSKAAIGALGQLGIAVADLDGLDADQKLALIADRIKDLGLSTGQASVLLQDLGIRNREMLLAVMAGGDAFRNARRDVEDYGLALSSTQSDEIELANDRIGRLGIISQYVGEQLALKLVPSFGRLAEAITDSMRAGGTLRTVIDALINNFERLSVYVGVAVAGFGVRYVAALVAARLATLSLSGALALLRTAIARTGIGLLIIGAAELVMWFGRLVSAAGGFSQALQRVYEVGKAVFLGVGNTAWGLAEIMAGVAQGIAASFIAGFALIGHAWDTLVNGMAAAWNALAGSGIGESLGLGMMGMSSAGAAIGGLADSLYGSAEATIVRGGQRIRDAGLAVADAVTKSLEPINAAGDGLDRATDAADDFADALDGVSDAAGGGKGGGGKSGASKAIGQAREALERLRKEYRDLQATIGMTAEQERIYHAVQELGTGATAAQIAEVQRLIPEIDRLKEAKERIARAAENGKRALESLFGSVIDGSKSAKQAVLDLLAQIARVQAMNAIFRLPGMGRVSSFVGDLLTPSVSADPLTQAIQRAVSPRSYEGGGFTGSGPRSGGVDGRGGFPAILHPNETVIDHTRGGGAGNITYAPTIHVGGNVSQDDIANIRMELARERQQLPATIARINREQRVRAG
ncbi:hypothetical protein [Paracoccus sp. (in: a-proteobacteria)]|uniref:hypothetical protein n=1 Tax=Paracoccus sp. TaxID=267 RepID=UPI00272C74AB|nr:hypothetical protein [Paracoccus sp. (in: a-proteobacteria)]